MKINIISGLFSFLIITCISLIIGGLLSLTDIPYDDKRILEITVFLIFLILIFIYRERIKKQYITWSLNIILNGLGDQFGITKIYTSFFDAKEDIVSDFLKSKDVLLFFQLGRADIGGQGSLLYDEVKNRNSNNFNMKILFADRKSSYLTKSRANDRDSNYREWASTQKYVSGSIDALIDNEIDIKTERHKEPYLWRLFFFDETLYFMPYLYKRHNHEKAPVFRIVSNGKKEGIIYHTFMRYFDNIWDKNQNE